MWHNSSQMKNSHQLSSKSTSKLYRIDSSISNPILTVLFPFDRCKCLINGVKVASASSESKQDSKRLAAIKSLKYLFKLFPVIKVSSFLSLIELKIKLICLEMNKEWSYKSLSESNGHPPKQPDQFSLPLSAVPDLLPQQTKPVAASSTTTTKYIKISTSDLFRGVIPSSLTGTNPDTKQEPSSNCQFGTY